MRSQQQQKQHNETGLFSSLKSMANDLIGNSPSHHHQTQQQHSNHSQQSVKRPANVSSTTNTPQINTNTTSKTQTLFPSYSTLQTALPQEIERVSSVLKNPNATLSQLEQGDRALDDLVVLLASQLVQLTELKRENSQKLINKLKQQSGSSNTSNSPVSTKSPVSTSTTSTTNAPQVVKTNNSSTPTTETSNKGFGALANRSTNTSKPSTPSSNAPVKATNVVPPKSTNPLESMLEWQENEVVVEAPKPQIKEQELFSMESFDDDFTHSTNNVVPTATSVPVTMDNDILGFDNNVVTTNTTTTVTQSADDILGFETSTKPKEGAFLDELLGTEKNGSQGGVMIDFSDEGQKIYQSNQILSMFDKPAETTAASILDAEDIPVATTTTVSSVDEFDF